MLDNNRPVLSITYPKAGKNKSLDRILIGAHDYYTGLNKASLTITANFPLGDVPAGTNLASRAKPISQGVWEIKLGKPIRGLESGRLTATIKDGQGNKARVERTFSVEDR